MMMTVILGMRRHFLRGRGLLYIILLLFFVDEHVVDQVGDCQYHHYNPVELQDSVPLRFLYFLDLRYRVLKLFETLVKGLLRGQSTEQLIVLLAFHQGF